MGVTRLQQARDRCIEVQESTLPGIMGWHTLPLAGEGRKHLDFAGT